MAALDGEGSPVSIDLQLMELQYKPVVLDGALRMPPYGTDCGLDLITSMPSQLTPGDTLDISCGVAVALPKGTFGYIVARSSTWVRWGLLVIPGVIDEGWRGELKVLVYYPPQNGRGEGPITIPKGTRLGQMLILPNLLPMTRAVEVDQLPLSERQEHGFGSSGL
jgi:dUTP pyrophosphatase